MKKEAKSQLDFLMDKYGQRLAEAKKRQEQIKVEENIFLTEFKHLRKKVIHPVMKNIGNRLKKHGHEYQISEQEESVDLAGRARNAKITMSIFPAGVDRSAYRPENTPSISFIAARYKKKIWVHGSSLVPSGGGTAGSRGEFNVAEITSDAVEREVLGVLKEIFDPEG
jgi:hypothetical protein